MAERITHNELKLQRHPTPTFSRQRIFEGFFPPAPTPYNPDGSVNLSAIPIIYEKLRADGAQGIFVNGTMGEALLNSPEDRRALLDAWISCTGPRATRTLKIIAHIGAESGRVSRELAAHAESAGVDAVACMSPAVFKPKDVAGLVGFLADVAAACPQTPFLYYHCTYVTGPTFRCIDVLKALDAAAPNMKGCKMTDADIGDLALCLQYFPDMDIFPAYDNQFLLTASLGASAFVMAGLNLIAPVYRTCWDKVRAGDFAGAAVVFRRVLDLWERLDVLRAGPYGRLCATVKAVMSLKCGVDLGKPCPPLASLPSEELAQVLDTLKDWGWEDWTVTPSA